MINAENLKLPLFTTVVIFLLACSVFLPIANPVISQGDGPEFTTAAYTLGIPHPPGYPLWMFSGRLFTMLPLGNIGWRANLASLTSVALAAVLVFLCTSKLASQRSAIYSALVFFTALPILQTVSGAEVYPQLILIIGLTFYLITSSNLTRERLYLIVLLLSFSFAIHYLSALFIPGWLLLSWIFARSALSLKKVLFSLFVVLLGLTIFIGLPIRSAKGPMLSWGRTERLDHFLKHVKRSVYKKMEQGEKIDWQARKRFAVDFIKLLTTRTYSYGGEVLLLFGFLFLFVKKRRQFFALSALFLLPVFLIIFFLRFPFNQLNLSRLHNYYLPVYLIGAIVVGCGYEYWEEKLGRTGRVFLIFALFSSIVGFVYVNYEHFNRRKSFFALDIGENIIKQLPKHTIYLAKSDAVTFPLWFMQAVNNQRLDVSLITTSFMQPSQFYWYRYHIRSFYPWMFVNPSEAKLRDTIMGINPWVNQIIAKFLPRQPIYYELNRNLLISMRYLFLNGTAYRLHNPREGAPDLQRTALIVDRYSRQRGVAHLPAYAPDKVREMTFVYAITYSMLGKKLHLNGERGKALYYLKRAEDIYPTMTSVKARTALIYEEQGETEKAVKIHREILAKNPDYPQSNLGMSRILEKRGDLTNARIHQRRFQKFINKRGKKAAKVKK